MAASAGSSSPSRASVGGSPAPCSSRNPRRDPTVKLVQMPTALLRVDEAELDAVGIDPGVLVAFRAYLPCALAERRGLLILVSAADGGHHLLMVLARRIGAALRDANIHLRDRGSDLRADRQKLCYLPGPAVVKALGETHARRSLAD